MLPEVDIEHCFWAHGYQDVFRRAAFPSDSPAVAATRKGSPKAVISRAIDRRSKPYLAALLMDTAIDRGPQGVPPALRRVIEHCVSLARHGIGKDIPRVRSGT
jgi:putative ATP-dependent endonuclease of OLD family